MKVSKQSLFHSNRIENNKKDLALHIRDIDTDLSNLHDALTGRIRFGRGTDGDRGENIAGEFQTYTSNATPNTEDTLAHTLGSVPVGYIVMGQDKAGSAYQLAGTGTAWTSSNIYLKCDVASVTFLLFLVK